MLQNMNAPSPKRTFRVARHSIAAGLSRDRSQATLTFFGLATTVVLTPFAVYRLLAGDLALAAVNFSVILVFAMMLIYTWRTGRSALAGSVLAGAITALAAYAAGYLGTDLAWVYVAVTANFLLANRRFALLASVALIAAVVVQGNQFDSSLEQLTFAAAAGLISMLNLIFAIRVNDQHQELSDLAALDPLTQVGNRRALTQGLQSAVDRQRISREPVSVVMLDLDHFKRLNDEYGHEAGDRVLVDLARIVNSRVRRGDGFYRFGGEEFVLLLSGTDRAGLAVVLANLREAFHAELSGPAGKVTVSMGAALLRSDESWSQWLGRADGALYDAKRAGRDRFEIAE